MSISSFLILYYPTHAGSEDLKPLKPAFDNDKFRTIRQSVDFSLPLKETIVNSKNPIVQKSLRDLIARADSYLSLEPDSVVGKSRLPPSGDKHDFLSLAPFHWPDDTKPGQIPYIYRDGEANPESYSIPDRGNLAKMITRVKILSAAYYFTDDTKYSAKATEFLRVWFLNNDTFMNPNLQYSEVITGKNNGTRSGIIAANNFPTVLDSISLIQNSPNWTSKDQKGIEQWFNKYLDWLLNSKFGKKESKQPNNHGTWYDVQASSISLFLNKTEITKNILDNNAEKLIIEKIQPNGSQPFEMYRHTSLDYHIFNLLGFFNLAKIGENIGIDLWNYKSPEGSRLQMALDYLLPYSLGKEAWPHEQIKAIDKITLFNLLCQATLHYKGNEYREALHSIGYQNETMGINGLIYGCVNTS